MKKIISFITLCSIVLISFVSLNFIFTKKAEAQNIGTLQNIVTPGFSFKKDLMLGDTDPDVKQLQKVLNADIDTMIISDDVGSRGKESTYFGQLTKDAVIKFQNKYKNIVLTLNSITTADGKVNRATRTRLNLLVGVMNTYDSVGQPQSRASTVVVTPAPVVITPPASTGPSMTVCNFINLLESVNIVTTDRANSARSTMGCAISGTFVDLKVNNSNGPITVAKNSDVTVSWTTGGMVSCDAGGRNKTLSGSETVKVGTTSQAFLLVCKTNAGASVSDIVTVNISGALTAEERLPPVLLDTTRYYFGYSLAMFDIKTDVPTKLYITYRTNSSDSKTVSFITLKADRIETVTGLTPNTKYYVKIRVVDANGNEFETDEFEETTSDNQDDNNPDDDVATSTEFVVKQRVLSTKGEGVLAVAGTDSLKLTSKVTLEAWVKPTAWSTAEGMSRTKDQVIISKGNIGENIDYALSLDNGRLVYSNNDAAMWTCSPVVPLNQWTHVAVSVDESTSTINLFINGVKVSSSTILTINTGTSTTATTTTNICEGKNGVFNKADKINKANGITNVIKSYIDQPAATPDYSSMSVEQIMAWTSSMMSSINSNPTSNVYIGNFYPKMCSSIVNKNNGFVGSLDDVRIWDKVRTEAEIKDNMKKSVKNKLDLVGYYTFDDETGADASVEGNTGALKGDVEIVDDEGAKSAVVAADFSYGSDYTVDDMCDPPKITSPTPEEKEYSVKVHFSGIVEQAGYCGGSDGNPNKYTLLVIKPINTTSSVVSVVDAEPGAWQPTYGGNDGSYGKGNNAVKLVLRHTPSSGPLPKVGDCVIGTSNGEPDTCSETTPPITSKGLATGQTISQACSTKGSGFIAGGIITSIGQSVGISCPGLGSKKSSNFFSKRWSSMTSLIKGQGTNWKECFHEGRVGSCVGAVQDSSTFGPQTIGILTGWDN